MEGLDHFNAFDGSFIAVLVVEQKNPIALQNHSSGGKCDIFTPTVTCQAGPL